MRMYSMYFVCKTYIEKVQRMGIGSRAVNGSEVFFIENWRETNRILNELAKVSFLKEPVKKVLDTIAVAYRDEERFDISKNTKIAYTSAVNKLIISMKTVIDMYEMLGIKKDDEVTGGFDVKLPNFNDLGEFAKCLEDLNFIITQCPYLQHDEETIKYGSVDVGSTWLTFMIVGASAGVILHNLSKLVDMAIKIKSHIMTVRTQEELLRSIQMKNEVAAEVFDTFREVNKMLEQQCIGDLRNELGPLKDGEEEGKAQKSIEKLAYWMDKGLQVYSAIDAPQEAKDLFPQQDDVSLLTDDMQKLLEMKNMG